MILLLNVLPYFLPWFSEPSSVPIEPVGEQAFKSLYINLLSIWVPKMGAESAEKVPMTDFISTGCPGIDKTEYLCSGYHSYQFATYGYLPLKIFS